jgi:hypothetical protein
MRLVLLPLLLVGCSMSSGVLKMGPDTYSLSVAASPAGGGVVGARQIALTGAEKYCSDTGKEILVTNTSSRVTTAAGAGAVDVTFRCLLRGDPDLVRPDYQRPPDTVIEDRRSK